MQTIDAIFTGGKFEPVGPVDLAENERVRLTIKASNRISSTETPASYAERWAAWMKLAQDHQARLFAAHGILPDSTPEIAEDRRNHV